MEKQRCDEKDFVTVSTSANILNLSLFLFCFTESYLKLLLGTRKLAKEKEDTVEKYLSQTGQNYAEFYDRQRENFAQALKPRADHIINTHGVDLVIAAQIFMVVECPTLDSLELLWSDFLAGHLDKVAERYVVTNELKKELNLEKICLRTIIEEQNYLSCKRALMEIPRTDSGE